MRIDEFRSIKFIRELFIACNSNGRVTAYVNVGNVAEQQ